MSLSQLATSSGISKGYLWTLENEPEDKRPSAETLYAVAEALGVTMSELLGRQLLATTPDDVPESLRLFAKERELTASDVRMLAGIQFRGARPQSSERWQYIYDAIRMSRSLDG